MVRGYTRLHGHWLDFPVMAMNGVAFALLGVLACTAAATATADTGCSLSRENREFIQEALQVWERAADDLLDVNAAELPWSVVFDGECAWHFSADTAMMPELEPVEWSPRVSGTAVPVTVVHHDGEVRLPSGGRVPARGLAFAGVYDGGKAYFTLALMDVWRRDPKAAADPNLRNIILGVVSHEIVHTLQLPAVAGAVDALRDRFDLPEDLNDDMVEERFAGDEAFVSALDREIELFYQAFAAPDREQRLALVRKGLEVARSRRAEFFTGDDSFYAPIEDLFLNMEGVGTWVSHRLGYGTETKAGELKRARNSWSQDEGLVLMLLVEELVPDWRDRVLHDLEAPFDLLEEATSGSAGSIPASGR